MENWVKISFFKGTATFGFYQDTNKKLELNFSCLSLSASLAYESTRNITIYHQQQQRLNQVPHL